ncbi:hypothetical protein [uncultured Sphingomonas sp.]|uniref:hypothetical protein n=1 Tax=uncultured Sphingomonas sp. TaxID=158754 RepID=UPI0025FCAF3F|nr:hypothetical protein [uncultured Sphingomonas sp.]
MELNTAQANLQQAVAALARDLPQLDTQDACARIAWLRREAMLEGFTPAVVMADGLADALKRDRRRTPVAAWLDALTLAAGCGRGTPDTAPALLASVGVRYAA